MSKERETLITDLSINAVDGFFYITQKLQAEIRELLTQKREPFGPEERQRLSKTYSTRAEQVAFEEGIIFAKILYGIGGE